MAGKKIVAAMRIKHNGEVMEADSEIDAAKFTEDELTRLYQRGAVKIVLETVKEPTQEDLDAAKVAADAKAKADEAAKATQTPVKPTAPTTPTKPVVK